MTSRRALLFSILMSSISIAGPELVVGQGVFVGKGNGVVKSQRSEQSALPGSRRRGVLLLALRHSGMRAAQTSDAQLRIGESRDSGFARSARAPE